MILEAWDIELKRVHSFDIILSENDTVTIIPNLTISNSWYLIMGQKQTRSDRNNAILRFCTVDHLAFKKDQTFLKLKLTLGSLQMLDLTFYRYLKISFKKVPTIQHLGNRILWT